MKILVYIISIFRSLYVSVRLFGVEGFKLPILISCNTKIEGLQKGKISFNCEIRPFMIKYGFGGSNGIVGKKTMLILGDDSKIIFNGKAAFGKGTVITNSGTINFGANFSCNKNTFISAYEQITFGDDVLIGWDCAIRDSDGHYIVKDDSKKKLSKPIRIGNHVWVCSYSHILKGVEIGNDSVVGYKSLVTRIHGCNEMIAGHPAKTIETGVNWEK